MTTEQIYNLLRAGRKTCTDTRTISPNCIFIALKGDRFNGNKYAEKAIALGADYAIIDENNEFESSKIIQVPDGLECLQKLANLHRKQFNIPVIGITGTNGKTTTKELILSVLSQKYNCLATQGNLNNHIGVPLTLLNLTKSHEIAIIEMGANHPGEIKELCAIAEPNYGVITNIGKAHLEGFGSFENIIKTKLALFKAVEKQNGALFINTSCTELADYKTTSKTITYGRDNSSAKVTGEITQQHPTLSLHFECSDCSGQIVSNLVGNYNQDNIIAATAVGLTFGVSPEKISKAIKEYLPQNNRSQTVIRNGHTFILDAYNANPSSMREALVSFSSGNYSNPIAVLGDMLELGPYALNEHQKVVDLLHELKFNQVILVGKHFNTTQNHDYITCQDSTEASEKLLQLLNNKSTVLLKGSRGIGLEKIMDLLP